MNSQPPLFWTTKFNDSAFEHNDFLTKTQADSLYISTTFLPNIYGTAQAGKIMITDASNSIQGINQIGMTTINYNGTIITATGTELNYLHGSTPGTATASNALVLDSSRNITNINSITASASTFTSGGAAISITGASGDIILSGVATSLQCTGTASSVVISGNSSFLSIGSSASLILNSITLTSTGTELNYLHGSTPGTATASNALVLDASRNITNINSLSAAVHIGTSTTASTSSATGAVQLAGGIGISLTTDATSSTNGGSITTAGGVAIAKSLWVGTTLNTNAISISGTTASTSSTTGILTLAGGIGISNTTDASSSTNGGTITTAGGVAIAKQIYVGGQTNTNGISNQGNILSGDVSGSNGLFRIVNSASVLYIQTGTGTGSGSSADLFFGNISQAFNASSRRLMLKAGGNFGIGTYSPQTNCVVNGNLRITNASDGSDPDYSQFSQVSGGSLKLTFVGSGVGNISTLQLQQSGATSNLGIASGIDMGTAYQTRCLALTATTGGIGGSEYYGFGTTSSQNLDTYSASGYRWLTGTTTTALGTSRMTLSSAGALVISSRLTVGDGTYIGCATSPNIINMASAGVLLVGTSTVANSSNWLEVAAGGGGTYSAYFAGRVGIGVSSPVYPLDVQAQVLNSTLNSFGYLAGSGSGTATGYTNRAFSIRTSAGIWVTGSEIDVLSDARSKRNINTISNDLVDKVMRLEPIRYQYKTQHDEDVRYHLGYRAQDMVKRGLPDLVGYAEADEPLGDQDIECDDGSVVYLRGNQRLIVNMHEMIPILHQIIKMQQTTIDRQAKEICELKKRIESIENILSNIRSSFGDAQLLGEGGSQDIRIVAGSSDSGASGFSTGIQFIGKSQTNDGTAEEAPRVIKRRNRSKPKITI